MPPPPGPVDEEFRAAARLFVRLEADDVLMSPGTPMMGWWETLLEYL